MNAPRLIAAALMLAFAVKCPAASLDITFAGLFDDCSACTSTPVEGLFGTAFSGRVVVPVTGTDLVPDDATRGVYTFYAPQTDLTLSSTVSGFGLDHVAPVRVLVNDCTGDLCAPKDDYVWFDFERNGMWYALVFSGYGNHLLASDAVPDVATLSGLSATFGIVEMGTFGAVNSSQWAFDGTKLVPGSMQLTVSQVPLPAAAGFLASGMLVLRRRHRAANAPLS